MIGRGPTGSRWSYLAVLCIGVLFLVAGCIGGNVREEAPLEVDRPTDPDEDCPEVEVLRETQYFAPRVLPIRDHGTTWPIDLRTGEAVEVWIGHGERDTSLPDLRITDPKGSLILDKDGYSSNDHRVSVETNGTHEITVENQYITKTAEWVIEIHWYPDIACA